MTFPRLAIEGAAQEIALPVLMVKEAAQEMAFPRPLVEGVAQPPPLREQIPWRMRWSGEGSPRRPCASYHIKGTAQERLLKSYTIRLMSYMLSYPRQK